MHENVVSLLLYLSVSQSIAFSHITADLEDWAASQKNEKVIKML